MPEKLKFTAESYFDDPEVQETKMPVMLYILREVKSVGFDETITNEEFNKYFEVDDDLQILISCQRMSMMLDILFRSMGLNPMEIVRKKFENDKNDLFNFDSNNN